MNGHAFRFRVLHTFSFKQPVFELLGGVQHGVGLGRDRSFGQTTESVVQDGKEQRESLRGGDGAKVLHVVRFRYAKGSQPGLPTDSPWDVL